MHACVRVRMQFVFLTYNMDHKFVEYLLCIGFILKNKNLFEMEKSSGLLGFHYSRFTEVN
jgi:hypothetical protein